MRLTNIFGGLRCHTLLCCLCSLLKLKAIFQLEVNDNKVVFISHPSSRASLSLSMEHQGVRGSKPRTAALDGGAVAYLSKWKRNALYIAVRNWVSNTYLLTPWNRVLLEKLTGSQLVKKFPACSGTRRFITAFTSTRSPSLS
jgi:hypothetical protein